MTLLDGGGTGGTGSGGGGTTEVTILVSNTYIHTYILRYLKPKSIFDHLPRSNKQSKHLFQFVKDIFMRSTAFIVKDTKCKYGSLYF